MFGLKLFKKSDWKPEMLRKIYETYKDKIVDFVAVDEIQMCSDHERGHIFTDKLLNLRGEKLTMFMGSNTIKNIISKCSHFLKLHRN